MLCLAPGDRVEVRMTRVRVVAGVDFDRGQELDVGRKRRQVVPDDRAPQPAGEATPGPPTSMVSLRYRFECNNPAALSVLELTVAAGLEAAGTHRPYACRVAEGRGRAGPEVDVVGTRLPPRAVGVGTSSLFRAKAVSTSLRCCVRHHQLWRSAASARRSTAHSACAHRSVPGASCHGRGAACSALNSFQPAPRRRAAAKLRASVMPERRYPRW
jgi:hypothetical protein